MNSIISNRNQLNNYWEQLRGFSKNVKLLTISSMLFFLSMGIFGVNFNLYILSVGLQPSSLGNVLTATAFAIMIVSIPIGFLAEKLGFRTAFIFIFLLSGISAIFQVATANLLIIMIAAFISGIARSGSFIVKLPFLTANAKESDQIVVFSFTSVVDGIAFAIGSVIGGYLPNLFQYFSFDLYLSYRYSLYLSGLINLIALIPIFYIKDHSHLVHKKISLAPYLYHFEPFLVKGSVIEFFLGLMNGLIVPFANVFFLFYLNVNREFYSWVEALSIIPIAIATVLGPMIGRRIGNMQTVVVSRLILSICLGMFIFSSNHWLGTASYLIFRALFSMSQSLWFAFSMATISKRAKTALSAWLQITFQIGAIVSSQTTGRLLEKQNHTLPFFLSFAAAFIAGILTWIFIKPYENKAFPLGMVETAEGEAREL